MTLLEILVVISIIAIITGITIPFYYLLYPTLKLNQATTHTMSLIREKQQKAISTQNQQIVDFNDIQLPQGVNISFEHQNTTFKSDSTPDLPNTITLSINNKNKIIEITSTGYVKQTQ